MITMTLLQYVILIFLEKKESIDENNKMSVQQLSILFDVKESIFIHDVSALIFNSFNKTGKLTDGLITTDGKEKKIESATLISINKNFSNTNVKFSTIPLSNVQNSKSQQEKEAEDDLRIKESYELQLIDLAATRIMKGRIGKDTKHAELVTEIVRQIDIFVPKVEQIKSRIESLIEKKILKRKDDFSDMYEYIS